MKPIVCFKAYILYKKFSNLKIPSLMKRCPCIEPSPTDTIYSTFTYFQSYIPSIKILADSLYQCGEFEYALLHYCQGARVCSDSDLTKFELGRTICLDTLLETFRDYKFDYELVR